MSRNYRSILRVVFLYLLFSVLWILSTDRLAHFLEVTYNFPKEIETYKGLLFVIISAALLFFMLYRELRGREADYQEHLAEIERLYLQLKTKNVELLDAYDRTIFGWSRVLEMRNREVKDHSRRVTELTLRLARYLGVSEADLVHIRRGALLHDIGKMAIPDAVILKEGELSEEERALVRRHPLFGFEMVSEIEFLRPAMDILLCHHEKWDGTGYPFGLSGEQIPLYARIFAVVDVWDAFTSDDRSYRRADPPEVAAEYLRAQAGEHFDPFIIEAFLKMLDESGELAPVRETVK
ncbi:MAG: HD domain-containing protein [Chloroflexi bacterium]|nr:MAG: HD domain-containing protein [Chloroflexota bacterium]